MIPYRETINKVDRYAEQTYSKPRKRAKQSET